MTLHQALDGARLVAAIVEHVHLRMRFQSIHDESDEAFEGRLLVLLGGRPDGEVAGLAIDLLDDTEEVLETDLRGPRVRLDVEEQVPRRRFREGRQSATRVRRVGRDELVDTLAGLSLVQLETRLFAQPGQLRCRHALDRPVGSEDCEARERRDARRGEAFRVHAAHPRDDREVVVAAAALDAHRVPGAHATVVHRIRVGSRRTVHEPVFDPRVEARPDVSEVGGEVVRPVWMADAVPGDDVEPLRGDLLEAFEKRGIDTHLEDRAALDRAGQLRIGDVVAPATERRAGAVGAFEQEVGVPAPATVEEGRLEDDVGPIVHRGQGQRLGGAQLVGRTKIVRRDLDDAKTARAK